MMHTENVNKKLLWKTFLAITLTAAAVANASAIEFEPHPGSSGDPAGSGGSGSVHLEGQGTLTAIFENACSGDRQVGIRASMLVGGWRGLNISTPENPHSRDSLWLNCGKRVTKTVKYDFPYRGDLQFTSIFSTVRYIDNWRNNQSFGTVVQYNWPADGTICHITYRGYMPPIADITCSKQ